MKCVYFIKPVGMDGPIKIGCSANPEQRLVSLTRKRRPLEIAAVIAGDYRVERQFHTLFREDHIGREWFFATNELWAVIEAIRKGSFDVSSLPESPLRLPRKEIEYTPERRARMAEAARKNGLWLAAYRAEKAAADAAGCSVSRLLIEQRLAQAA